MSLALALTIIAGLLLLIVALLIPVVMIRKGLAVKYVYRPYPDDPADYPRGGLAPVVPGEIIIGEEDTAFFDERDLAAMEAHKERPEFVKTRIFVNGVETGPDGIPSPEQEKGWLRR